MKSSVCTGRELKNDQAEISLKRDLYKVDVILEEDLRRWTGILKSISNSVSVRSL